jgi:hypothetical protein
MNGLGQAIALLVVAFFLAFVAKEGAALVYRGVTDRDPHSGGCVKRDEPSGP